MKLLNWTLTATPFRRKDSDKIISKENPASWRGFLLGLWPGFKLKREIEKRPFQGPLFPQNKQLVLAEK